MLKKLSPAQLLVLLFILLITAGAVLLKLPFSTRSGISFTDALFTSTSAACVTGLTVLDTPHDFTFFGQLIILLLIQIGGIGIMTFSAFITLLMGKRIGLYSTLSLKEDLNLDRMNEIRKILFAVVRITFWFELTGAFFLSLRFYVLSSYMTLEYSPLYLGIFHSISAFCNAGFALFSDSLHQFRGDVLINLVIMLLIFSGGLGFFVITDIVENKMRPNVFTFRSLKMLSSGKKRRLQLKGIGKVRRSGMLALQTKVVLLMSLLLILISFSVIFITEITHNPVFRLLPWNERILGSLFAAVTPRTAGFDTISISDFSIPTQFLFVILMFIGASPGSTGGGIKTTSIALLFLATYAVLTSRDEISVFRKKITWEHVNKAQALIIIALSVVFINTFLLTLTEKCKFFSVLFEVTSAFGTVGLSTGITPFLSTFGKLVITVTMLIGRLGALTLAFSLSRSSEKVKLSYPEESIMIG